MTQQGRDADQLLCDHAWEAGACARCGLSHAAYVEGTVRAALTLQGVWDDEDEGADLG